MDPKYLPNQDPAGKRFTTNPGDPNAQMFRIVGIVGDVREMGLNESPRGQEMYFPTFQFRNN
jgi:hypothetical protein